MNYEQISAEFLERLTLEYEPVGLIFSNKLPEDYLTVSKNGNGCIAPLILQSGKGKQVVFYEGHFGYSCSAFYLGYKDWIFPGIENFLSIVDLPSRKCEKFVQSPELAKKYIESLKFPKKSEDYAIFKPLRMFRDDEEPEVVIFFCNSDQISGLTFLTYFDDPLCNDRIITMFASSCASVAAIPLKYSRNREKKAVYGFHDISARARHSKEILSISFTPLLFSDMVKNMKESFLYSEQWERIRNRNMKLKKD